MFFVALKIVQRLSVIHRSPLLIYGYRWTVESLLDYKVKKKRRMLKRCVIT